MVAHGGLPTWASKDLRPRWPKARSLPWRAQNTDPRYFQISVPLQPGNSGGALLDERGNVVGVVSAKRRVEAALADKRCFARKRELRRQEQLPA